METGYSKLFDSIGIGTIDIGIIITILLVLIILCLGLLLRMMLKMKRMENKLKIFMSGKDGVSLEQNVLTLHEENKYLKTCADKNRKDIKALYKKAEKAFCKIGLIRYDAFQQMGGKLSFSLALLDENNDGFIINSVHSMDGCYSYTKAVQGGVCDINLSKEEEKALTMAMQEKE